MKFERPPEVPQEPGCAPIPAFGRQGEFKPFLQADESRIRLALFFRDADRRVVGRIWFGPHAQGPPGHAHGGSIAAALDEAMGACCWMNGHRVLAARLTIHYRGRLPLGTDARVEAWIERVEGRKIYALARLTDEAGRLFDEADGLFVELNPEQYKEIIEQTHIPSWDGPGA